MNRSARADRGRAGQAEPFEGEIGAAGQPLAGPAGDRLGGGRDRVDRAGVEVGRFQRLGQVERPGLAVGADAAPVVDPEGGVGHLLDLGQHHPRADRVDRPGRDQDAVARPGREAVQQRLDRRPAASAAANVVPGDARPQPGVDQAARLGVDDHPGLGLAVVVGQAPAALVVGVDLDREDLLGVEELDQQRELLARRRPPARAAPSPRCRTRSRSDVPASGPSATRLTSSRWSATSQLSA